MAGSLLKPRAAIGAAVSCALLLAMPPARAVDAAGEAAAVVTAFNAALTARRLDDALVHLAAGGVQYSLRPSHPGINAPQPLTTDLRAHWSMIVPVIFASTTSYKRSAAITDTRAVNDIATVWTDTVTESLRAGQPAPRRDRFSEVYLLVRKDGKWQIAGIADSRKPNDVGLGAGGS